LGLTNRILAGIDALTYFTPYWAYRMAELRGGHLPLWNPYLFTGAPFLANPQAAVLYPLHWPLIWLEPAQALIWSALVHVWLACGFMCLLARRSLGLSWPASWLAGALFGLGGFTLAKIENINQLNGLAWLPALLWLFDEACQADGVAARVRWGVALAIAIALQLLAGHTQTAFINLTGLIVYGAWPLVRLAGGRMRRRSGAHPAGTQICSTRQAVPPAFRCLLAFVLATAAAVTLSAAQLLPSLELTRLSARAGGLPYRLAVSFSLHPSLLLQTLLPPVGGGLAQAFGSEGYAEFVGYVGVTALVLAGIGASGLARSRANGRTSGRRGGLVMLAGVGLFLALGAYNPVSYVLWRFAPGFDLFRAPARWLALYSVAIAGLAGMGWDAWLGHLRSSHRPTRWPAGRIPQISSRARVLSIVGLLAVAGVLAVQQLPTTRTLFGWCAAAALTVAFLCAGRRWPRLAQSGLIVLVLCELWVAGRALPFALATAPAALGLRNATAALMAAGDEPPASRGRFLSMSDIRYDPGDLPELRTLQFDRLPDEAVERLVRAAKWHEVLAPNLSLLWRLPAIDGYDGGVLPTADFGGLQSLFLPSREPPLPDGRLREQLTRAPPDSLLDLAGVQYLITDKQRDLWADDVYYDLEQTVTLAPGESLELDLRSHPQFSATGLGVVAAGDGAPAQAEVETTDAGANHARRSMAVDEQPPAASLRPQVIPLAAPMAPTTLAVRVLPDSPAALVLHGLSLINVRTGAHQSITLSRRGELRRIHSGDVKVYERLATPGRAWIVHGVRPVRNSAEALRALSDPVFNPRETVVAESAIAGRSPGSAAPGESATVVSYEPERVVLRVDVASPAFLVLADAMFPGWEAAVDGVAVPMLRANLMFRAVALEPGEHEVVFAYRPASWRRGLAISLAAIGVLALMLLATFMPWLRVRQRMRYNVGGDPP
jgi:hypothetical protein